MKNLLVVAMALAIAVPVSAQQNKQRITIDSVLRDNAKQNTGKKNTPAQKKTTSKTPSNTANKTTDKAKTNNKPAKTDKTANKDLAKQAPKATASAIRLGAPTIIDGHLAFNGVPLGQSKSKIKQQLEEAGMIGEKDENKRQCYAGRAYGVSVQAYVESKTQLSVREEKSYTKAQALSRIEGYQKAFIKDTGGKVVDNTLNKNGSEGGTVVIETRAGIIEIGYYNQDEVNFSSKNFDIILSFIDG